MKVLIGYASRHGSTQDAAALLAKALPGEVELCDLNKTRPDPAAYDLVALGGAVYAGTLPKALKGYCKTHEAALAQKPLGLFVCCSEATPDEFLQANLPAALLQRARSKASFGGEFRPAQMNVFEKALLKMVAKANGGKPAPSLDREAIERFAAAIVA